jgi:RHS repeat-associated protein
VVKPGVSNTRFLTDGDAIVAEYDGANALTSRYVHGSNLAADDPLVWYAGAGTGTKRYLHADHLGSIVAATNPAAAPTINAYDEYGVPKAGNAGRFQYTGQIWLSELGLYHYKARLYSPTLGRFLQTDPVGYQGGINLYAYVVNDPISAGDPSGHGMWVKDDLPEIEGSPQSLESSSRLPRSSPSQQTRSEGQAPTTNIAWSGQRGGPRGGVFTPPTNEPAEPPIAGPAKPAPRGGGYIGAGEGNSTIRVQPRSSATSSRGYPDGYWVQTKNNQEVDPSTGKPPSGDLTPSERAARTHNPLPKNSPWNEPVSPAPTPTPPRNPLGMLGPLYLACYFLGICDPAPAK